jgi:hypothetical protein
MNSLRLCVLTGVTLIVAVNAGCARSISPFKEQLSAEAATDRQICSAVNATRTFQRLLKCSPHPAWFIEDTTSDYWDIAIGENMDDHFVICGRIRVMRNSHVVYDAGPD